MSDEDELTEALIQSYATAKRALGNPAPEPRCTTDYDCVCGHPADNQQELDAHRDNMAKVDDKRHHWPISDRLE